VLSAISFSAKAFPNPEKGCRCNHLRADAFVQYLSKNIIYHNYLYYFDELVVYAELVEASLRT